MTSNIKKSDALNILSNLNTIIKLQKQVLENIKLFADLEEQNILSNQLNITTHDLEKIEKIYFSLSSIIRMTNVIMIETGLQKEKFYILSNKIRNSIKKDVVVSNKYKCVDILTDPIKENGCNITDSYKSIELYHQLQVKRNKQFTLKKNISILSNFSIELPVIEKLKNIPPMFYWYNGDAVYKKGIYAALCEGFYIEIPFPNLIGKHSKFFKRKKLSKIKSI